MSKSTHIDEMIQGFQLDAVESPEITTSRILHILDAINQRIDYIEMIYGEADKIDSPRILKELREIHNDLKNNWPANARKRLADLLLSIGVNPHNEASD